MEPFLIVLLILFFIIVMGKYKGLKARIERLERLVVFLENQLNQRADAASESEPVAEPQTDQPPDREVALDTPKISSDTIQQPGEVEQLPFEAVAVEASETEFLEDFVLPEPEPRDSLHAQGSTVSSVSGSDEPSPSEPSAWAERWRSFKATVDWEQFTGVKLFAWLGGLALFVAFGLFVKVSIDRNWIPPAFRLAISAVIGVGMIMGAGRFKERKYRVMRHTLAAGGIGVLFSVVFAATLYYQYLTAPLGFGLLVLVALAAFVLAVFYRSKAVCLLGALGAYATPMLVSTGQNNLLLLFGYLVVVNAGIYQVARRLSSQGVLLAACVGTAVTLGFGSLSVFDQTNPTLMACTWLLNLGVFVFSLGHTNVDPAQNQSTRYTGIIAFGVTLATGLALLMKSGWAPLLVVTVAQTAAILLANRQQGWYRYVIPCSALGFLVALAWVLFNFKPAHFSIGFILLLLYGVFGGLGPLALVYKYGLNRKVLFWFRAFPLAIVMVSLTVIFQQPVVSFWFWPLLLGLELIGLGISLLFRAFVQVGVLVLIFVLGALNWLFHVPSEALGLGFFLFIMGAGVVLCVAVFLVVRRLPDLVSRLNLAQEGQVVGQALPAMQVSEQWLAAAPAAGVCVLLGASFFVNYPNYPHPGMVTVICFLLLVLFAVRRLGYEIPGVAALLGAGAAQAVFVFHPVLGPPVYFYGLVWSGLLFLTAVVMPFIFFNDFAGWKRLWYGWALFEILQAVFILYISRQYWHSPENQWMAQWVPLALAICKLPFVAMLIKRLGHRPERNSILAFHGGVLLFYFSALPVLVLDHGWIGLTFIFEATALLWLNGRIAHPGLRWVALALAPAGLAIVFINLPQLKTAHSLPLLNSAVLSTIAGVVALALAVPMAASPQRRLKRIDLPSYFLWLTAATGFMLVNLIVADLFAEPGLRFKVWPGHSFVQWACYALAWVVLGGLLRRMVRLPERMRTVGLYLVAAGAIGMILLPMALPQAAAHMRPLFNAALALYLPLVVLLYYLFHQEPWKDPGSIIKNGLLALFLMAVFTTFKFQKGILVAPGYPFALLTSHTPTKGATSAAGWLIYGLGLLLWPKRLDRPFRIAGLILIVLGVGNALILPFKFRVLFAQMAPLINLPTLVYVLCLAALIYLTIRKWDLRWPLPQLAPRLFWGLILALSAFAVLNIEIASVFALKDRPFSMMPHGSFAMQLAYSIGWLLFAIGLLGVGIRWDVAFVRKTAILAIIITAFKIFVLDVWSLDSMYRVGSVLGLAVVLILVSFLYQRFFSEGEKDVS